MLESHYQQQVCFSDGLPGELLSGTERDNVIFRGPQCTVAGRIHTGRLSAERSDSDL